MVFTNIKAIKTFVNFDGVFLPPKEPDSTRTEAFILISFKSLT